MKKTSNKVVLIGAGAVGTSFMYAAINQGVAENYVLIDAFPQAAEGNALDLADTMAVLPTSFTSIKAGNYADCGDADVIVITAGRPQKEGETRLDMVAGNAIIMKSIAEEVKKSGFKGITVIASNPVDVLTYVYQKVTGFDEHKVIGSGTTLDSARLRRLVADKLKVSAQSVNAFLAGEHGDSSVAVWSHATVMEKPIFKYIEEGKISQAELDQIREDAVHMAYKIIELKRATFYGIGVCLTRIVKAVLRDEMVTLMVGAKLNGEFNNKDVYTGVPAIIGKDGWSEIINWDLTKKEQEQFNASCSTLKESIAKAEVAIK
ncbi:L-lactate dehydrogenase [Williamsoniiplasma somnilux]|uniref:L-lactate dehydrogenase n=1 Tax=Williamsoniiplasma somnilux TaxID=215578 RepID=A0A2K8NZU8_9MOLU|nr:L-lactate dehydrogenase [Williamsoniiplasma somnilux]ATZ18738.1 L-lactate dehydrogenase [Williamsoniiplasma somnilux]